MLGDLAPRPPHRYDPTTPPHRDEQGVHLYDHRAVRALLRDPVRVTSDVTEAITPEQRAHLHPVSSFVWATDRRTVSGCPGRHAPLRSVMAPWFTPQAAAARQPAARIECERLIAQLGGSFDVHDDYAQPAVVAYLADWLGVTPADVEYSVDDQIEAGDIFLDWPPLSSSEMDDRFRDMVARARPGGVVAQTRDLVRAGVMTERESWGVLYAFSVSAIATATTIALAAGLCVDGGLWGRMADAADAARAVEEAVRYGSPFPHSSRFAREPFTAGDLAVEPGEQVLMWLTAANRGLPGEHRRPLDEFDPWRDVSTQVGWGSGYHRCGGVHHGRAVATTALRTLAELVPGLAVAGPWERFAGIDDGFVAAPAHATRKGHAVHSTESATR